MTLDRLWGRLLDAAFPAFVGIPATPIEDLLTASRSIQLVIREIDKDRRAGSLWDLMALASVVRVTDARRIFEIGTGAGRTTLNLAANTAEDATVFSLDLLDLPRTGHSYQGQPEARKIRQLFGDAETFAFDEWFGTCDFIFVDGDHRYPGVMRDSLIALKLVKPGGYIFWDDLAYGWPGVWRALRELSKTHAIRRVAGTKLAYYRHDGPLSPRI